MAIASGVAKQLRYKQESAWGTAPGASGAQLMRRVESSIDLVKDTYQSNEIRADYQISDFRHGGRRVEGSIRGELSCGTHKDFIAAALRRDFAAVTAATGLSLTIAGTGPTYTVTRGAGSWLTDGFKVGMGIRLSVGTLHANNINKNLYIVGLTATIATVMTMNGSAMQAEGPIASCTATATGKTTYVPTTGHLDRSFAIEHWYADIAQSELFTGCKADTIALNMPATGIAGIDIGFKGKDITAATAAYYTSPTAATTSGVLAAANGLLVVGGTAIATVTGLTLNVAGGYSGEAVVGSNSSPAIFPGRVNVSGQLTALFEDATLRDAFLNETEVALLAVMTESNIAAANFFAVTLPRIKFGGAQKNDGERGLQGTFPFQALFNGSGGSGTSSEQTTLMVQDTLA